MDQWLIGITYLMFSLLDPALPLSLFYVHMTMIKSCQTTPAIQTDVISESPLHPGRSEKNCSLLGQRLNGY